MNFLFKPIDNASLIFFRIAFGILAFADILGIFAYYHLYTDSFNPEKFQFKYYGFEWVQPLPEPIMTLFFLALLCITVLIIVGKWYRWAMTIFAFSFAYIFFLEKAHYLNHGYLVIWLSFIMILLPVNRNFSVDVLQNPDLQTNRAPFWCLFILQFLMGVVYFYGGLAKINADWLLRAQPLKIWLSAKSNMPVLGWIWKQELTAWIMSWGGFCLDFFIVFFLLFRRMRIWAFGFVLFFHFVNLILFQIGIFPWMSLCLTALFFDPDFPRQIYARLKEKWPKFGKIEAWWQRKTGAQPTPPPAPPTGDESLAIALQNSNSQPAYGALKRWRMNRVLVLSFLIPICLFHLIYPFRHHFIDSNVTWTEEGHRYSWRMMLRHKRGYGTFIIEDKKTGKTEKVNLKKYLSDRQYEKVYTHPDMILQFAHFLEKTYWEKRGKEVAVYADIKAKLNHRNYQQYIDKTVDLTQLEWSFLDKADWIVPLKEEE